MDRDIVDNILNTANLLINDEIVWLDELVSNLLAESTKTPIYSQSDIRTLQDIRVTIRNFYVDFSNLISKYLEKLQRDVRYVNNTNFNEPIDIDKLTRYDKIDRDILHYWLKEFDPIKSHVYQGHDAGVFANEIQRDFAKIIPLNQPIVVRAFVDPKLTYNGDTVEDVAQRVAFNTSQNILTGLAPLLTQINRQPGQTSLYFNNIRDTLKDITEVLDKLSQGIRDSDQIKLMLNKFNDYLANFQIDFQNAYKIMNNLERDFQDHKTSMNQQLRDNTDEIIRKTIVTFENSMSSAISAYKDIILTALDDIKIEMVQVLVNNTENSKQVEAVLTKILGSLNDPEDIRNMVKFVEAERRALYRSRNDNMDLNAARWLEHERDLIPNDDEKDRDSFWEDSIGYLPESGERVSSKPNVELQLNDQQVESIGKELRDIGDKIIKFRDEIRYIGKTNLKRKYTVEEETTEASSAKRTRIEE